MTDTLAEVVTCCHLLLARDGETQRQIAGLASLACFTTPFTRHGRVEDVVVDQEYRGHGIGREMMRQAPGTGKGRRRLGSRPDQPCHRDKPPTPSIGAWGSDG